jgi:WD40 repeat protein
LAITVNGEAERFVGTPDADVLTGTNFVDVLVGEAGADTLSGGLGNDSIDGGLGDDTATYVGAKSGYQIVPLGDGYTVIDTNLVDGNEGSDSLTGIERLVFADGTMSLVNSPATGGVSVSGTASEDETLSVVDTLADLDGLSARTYAWQSSSDGTTWATIGSGSNLMLGDAQVGRQIRVIAGRAQSVLPPVVPRASSLQLTILIQVESA